MIELFVIADDVTGALDTACQFGMHGIPTAVYPGGAVPWDALEPEIRVAVVNTNTRHLPESEAYALLAQVVRDCTRRGICRVLKKIDSALRGNWGAELRALLDSGTWDRLYLLPAYPDGGRTTEGGVQLLNGVEISETAYAQDPFNPVHSARVADHLPQTSRLIPAQAPLPQGPGTWILDAVTNSHLDARCREFPEGPLLLAGCAGLAGALARSMVPSPFLSGFPAERSSKLLIVSGSLHRVSRSQIRYARQAGIPCVTFGREIETAAAGVRDAFRSSSTVILETPSDLEAGCAPGTVSGRLAQAAALVYQAEKPLSLAVFGGDTLLQLIPRILREGLYPLEEIVPGVPVSLARDRENHRVCLISKSGGFGPENVVEQIQAYVFSENQGGIHYGTNHARHL